jgi:hypothetical protein
MHVSKKEQKKRFMERLDGPDKNWKFSATDAVKRVLASPTGFVRADDRNTATDYAVVRHSGGQQVVHALAVSDAIIDCDGEPRSQVSEDRRCERKGTCGRAQLLIRRVALAAIADVILKTADQRD